jgi:hypothetical protein
MTHDVSLPPGQMQVTCPCPEPDQSSAASSLHSLKIQSQYHRPIYVKFFQVFSFPQSSPTNHICTPSLSQNMSLLIIREKYL